LINRERAERANESDHAHIGRAERGHVNRAGDIDDPALVRANVQIGSRGMCLDACRGVQRLELGEQRRITVTPGSNLNSQVGGLFRANGIDPGPTGKVLPPGAVRRLAAPGRGSFNCPAFEQPAKAIADVHAAKAEHIFLFGWLWRIDQILACREHSSAPSQHADDVNFVRPVLPRCRIARRRKCTIDITGLGITGMVHP
jgi:hypothetical protein